MAAWQAAGGSCVANTPSFSTVIIGSVQKAPPVNSFLSFTCTGVNPPKPGRKIVYCWHIHGGDPNRKFAYREAVMGRNKINLNFYAQDWDGATKRIGNIGDDYNILGDAKRTGTNGKTDTYAIQTPFTLRFEGNPDSASFPEGRYTYSAGGTDFTLSNIAENDEMNNRNACKSGGDNGIHGSPRSLTTTMLNISVKTYCNVRVSQNMLFPKQTSLEKPVKTQAIVNADCSAGTDYKVKISKGDNYFDNMRHMRKQGSTETMAYQISSDEWTGIGFGTPQGEDYVIDGLVPVQKTPPVGQYQDRLVVTIDIVK